MDANTARTSAWTVGRLLAWTREHFERRGLDAPRLCAEILLAHAMRCERLRLFTRHDEAPAEEVLARFRESVRQAAAGKPIAYLTGTKDFFSLAFDVTPDVLIPRPETEILVERTIDWVRKRCGGAARILDLCTGSGCIAVALARHLPNSTIVASDVSAAALAVARRNAVKHEVDGRVMFAEGDLFAACPGVEPFDVIVSNPPYVAENDPALAANVRDYEPPVALFGGDDGLAVLRRIIADAPAALRVGGSLLLEIGYNQAAAVRELLRGTLWSECSGYKDGGGHERVIHARRAPER